MSRKPRKNEQTETSDEDSFFAPPSPAEIRARARTFVWEEHEQIDFDLDEFLAAIHEADPGHLQSRSS